MKIRSVFCYEKAMNEAIKLPLGRVSLNSNLILPVCKKDSIYLHPCGKDLAVPALANFIDIGFHFYSLLVRTETSLSLSLTRGRTLWQLIQFSSSSMYTRYISFLSYD
jgi:hypothetical protein